MYTIEVDGNTLYAPNLFHEGYGVFSPKLTLEMNKAGSLEFILPSTNHMYDQIQKLKSVVKVFQNGTEIFSGRVLHDEKDFYNQKSVYCEGELAYLLDSLVRPYDHDATEKDPNRSVSAKALFTELIENHNDIMTRHRNVSAGVTDKDEGKLFTVGKVDVKEDLQCSNYDYPTTLEEINSLVDAIGGYLSIRKVDGVRYIDWLVNPTEEDNPEPTTTQTIEFGSNLLDLTEHITAENVCTIVVPVGAVIEEEDGGDGKTKLTMNDNGRDYVKDSTAIRLFGRIEHKVDFSEVSSASKLESLAKEYLKESIESSISMTIKAVDLHYLDVDTDSIHVTDFVRVISLPHGLDKPFQCTKIVYDLESPDQNEYNFGLEYTSLTAQQMKTKKGSSKLSSIVLED